MPRWGKEWRTMEKDSRTLVMYRMDCSESSGGLSHYIIYGDIPKEKTGF